VKKILLIIAVLTTMNFGQVSADLTIENQEVVGTDFLFDIYLTRTESNDIYLGTGDLVLTFNSSAFTNPVITRESSTYWNLTSTSGFPVGILYRATTSPASITSNELIINLNQVPFGDQQEFDDNIAKIDNTPLTHRIGRYKVSGISNPSEYMNLQWKTIGTGITTQVFTLSPVSPWTSSPVNINAIDPTNAPLPVELTSFTARASTNQVLLNWETKTEVSNYGFEIEKASLIKNATKNWQKIGFVNGHGNSNSPKEYSYTDKNVNSGNYYYRLKQIDTDGQYEYSDEVSVVVETPADYVLEQNYPNPFNPSTKIKFSIPEAGMIKLTIYDLLGQEVKTLVEEAREAGSYSELFDASGMHSGIYFYELRVNGFILTKKMQLLK